MNSSLTALILAAAFTLTLTTTAQELVRGRPSLVLENSEARLVVDLRGGAIGDFHLLRQPLNPLQWGTPREGDTNIHGFGHFLCLDRWGPPSDAEGRLGMPYHGEAANVAWALTRPPAGHDGVREAELTARLPKAGLAIRRTVRFSSRSAAFGVREDVTNENALGRMYNQVQHPTVGPPFLDVTTVVDCNGGRGFAQGGRLPHPEEPTFTWPEVAKADGTRVDLRRLTTDPNPDVVSFLIEGDWGWITAATPGRGLLIGYLWRTRDYPWVSVWRSVDQGRPGARGLEFGTTGLHQHFPILAQKPRIWDQPTFAYLDAGQTVSRSYTAFLLTIPADFTGVQSLRVEGSRIELTERGPSPGRRHVIEAAGVLPP